MTRTLGISLSVGLLLVGCSATIDSKPSRTPTVTKTAMTTVTAEPTSTPTVTKTRKVRVTATVTRQAAARAGRSRSDHGRSSSGSGTSRGGGGPAQGSPWYALMMCESSGNPRAYNPAGPFYGLFQFTLPTWRSVGGTGDPRDASPAEQLRRAQILQSRSGWGQWPACAAKLGLL